MFNVDQFKWRHGCVFRGPFDRMLWQISDRKIYIENVFHRGLACVVVNIFWCQIVVRTLRTDAFSDSGDAN